MMDWKTIETAPKDGTIFLAASHRHIYTCRWGSLYLRGPDGDKYGWVKPDGDAGNSASPSHWMPLPVPPA